MRRSNTITAALEAARRTVEGVYRTELGLIPGDRERGPREWRYPHIDAVRAVALKALRGEGLALDRRLVKATRDSVSVEWTLTLLDDPSEVDTWSTEWPVDERGFTAAWMAARAALTSLDREVLTALLQIPERDVEDGDATPEARREGRDDSLPEWARAGEGPARRFAQATQTWAPRPPAPSTVRARGLAADEEERLAQRRAAIDEEAAAVDAQVDARDKLQETWEALARSSASRLKLPEVCARLGVAYPPGDEDLPRLQEELDHLLALSRGQVDAAVAAMGGA